MFAQNREKLTGIKKKTLAEWKTEGGKAFYAKRREGSSRGKHVEESKSVVQERGKSGGRRQRVYLLSIAKQGGPGPNKESS